MRNLLCLSVQSTNVAKKTRKIHYQCCSVSRKEAIQGIIEGVAKMRSKNRELNAKIQQLNNFIDEFESRREQVGDPILNEYGVDTQASIITINSVKFTPSSELECNLQIKFNYEEMSRDLPTERCSNGQTIEYTKEIDFTNFDSKSSLFVYLKEKGKEGNIGMVMVNELKSGIQECVVYHDNRGDLELGRLSFFMDVTFNKNDKINEHVEEYKQQVRELETELSVNAEATRILKSLQRISGNAEEGGHKVSAREIQMADGINRRVMGLVGNQSGGWRGIIKMFSAVSVCLSLVATSSIGFLGMFMGFLSWFVVVNYGNVQTKVLNLLCYGFFFVIALDLIFLFCTVKL